MMMSYHLAVTLVRTCGWSRLVTQADAALLGSALNAPYDNLMVFNGMLPPHSGLLTFITHAFDHEADIPWDKTRCMIWTAESYSLT